MAAAVVLVLGFAGWKNGYARGAASAIVDGAQGRPKSYSIGCTNDWPREAKDFRVREILNRDYHIEFLTVGGAAPSPFIIDFADAYDAVSYRLLRLRYSNDFAEKVTRRAAADVYDHEVTIEGCYWAPRELVTPDRDIIVLDRALPGAEKKTVRVQGRMTDIGGSKWRSWGWPLLRVADVQVLGDACGKK